MGYRAVFVYHRAVNYYYFFGLLIDCDFFTLLIASGDNGTDTSQSI